MLGAEPIVTAVIKKALEAFADRLPSLADLLLAKASDAISVADVIRKLKVDPQRFAERLEYHRQVRTILQPIQALDLMEIYVPLVARMVDDPEGHTIDPADPNWVMLHKQLILMGTAGQGKSFIMRKLAVTFLSADRPILPLFIELRRLGTSGTLEELLSAELRELGIDGGSTVLQGLATAGAVAILLDGFDEMSLAAQTEFLEQFKTFQRVIQPEIVVISTRPGTSLLGTPYFRVAKVDYLNEPQLVKAVRTFLRAFGQNDEDKHRLVERVEVDGKSISEIARTPLLVALLFACYIKGQEIPRKLSDFYDQIFAVMYTIHDKTKGPVQRIYRAPLSTNEAKKIFCALCFECEDRVTWSSDDFVELIQSSIQACTFLESHRSVRAEDFFQDIVDVTCLVVRDGSEFSFIHKSLVEYHAALHFSRFEDNDQKAVFASLVKGETWRRIRPFMGFYAEIDQLRYERFFLVPLLRNVLHLATERQMRSHEGLVGACRMLHLRYELHDGECTWESAFSRPCRLGEAPVLDLWNEPTLRRLVQPLSFPREFSEAAVRQALAALASKLEVALRELEDLYINQRLPVLGRMRAIHREQTGIPAKRRDVP